MDDALQLPKDARALIAEKLLESLDFEEPFIYRLVRVLVQQMGEAFPELAAQKEVISQVIKEEETSFLRTLSQGIKRFEQYLKNHPDSKVIEGSFAFELFDTFGFPIDLTQLMAREKDYTVDMDGFNKGLAAQKERSRKAAEVDAGDWIIVRGDKPETEFLGYQQLDAEARILKYRKVSARKKTVYEIVLDRTPFYAESGGQVGDKGVLEHGGETIHVIDTKKENNLIVHITKEEPKSPEAIYLAKVNPQLRLNTVNNHSATHLMHAALRKVLGNHVEQKGSLVDDKRLRFDFSHFTKMTEEEIREVEDIVNSKIRENIHQTVNSDVPIDEAMEMGAMALFGEKYGERVRVITFDPKYSVELCGGTHVDATGQIGLFKISSEGAIAAGVRRVEAVTGSTAEAFVNEQIETLRNIKDQFKNQKNTLQAVQNALEQNRKLEKELEKFQKEKALQESEGLFKDAEEINGVKFITRKVDMDVKQAKDLAFKLRSMGGETLIVLALVAGEKVNLVVSLSDGLIEKGMNAGTIIKQIAQKIKGGGGGQPHMATAGGKDAAGIEAAFKEAKGLLN